MNPAIGRTMERTVEGITTGFVSLAGTAGTDLTGSLLTFWISRSGVGRAVIVDFSWRGVATSSGFGGAWYTLFTFPLQSVSVGMLSMVVQRSSTMNLYKTFSPQLTETVAVKPRGPRSISTERSHCWKKEEDGTGYLRICKITAPVRAYLIKGSGDDDIGSLIRPTKRNGSEGLTGK